jgi:hypothetical protein
VNLARRVYRVYRNDGAHAVVVAAGDEIRRRAKWHSPKISWTRLGPVSMLLARMLKPQAPPLLILSAPRSGSSWIGETLGRAQNALYLREPITQSCLAYFRQSGLDQNVMYEPDSSAASEVFARTANRAFSGLPTFPPYVVKFPNQWGLGSRKTRRLVIKEVNPMACRRLVEQYQPRVILLVRHPAAVSLSYVTMGWLSRPVGRQLGERLGTVLRAALDVLMDHHDYRVVTYEDLCADPVGVFRSLYEFAELAWDTTSEPYIQRRASGEDAAGRDHRYGTSRDSRSMIRAWEGKLSEEELDNLRAGYSSFDLPWYRALEDWSQAPTD